MSKKLVRRLVREGAYVADVEIEVVEDENGWSPHLSLKDALKLDDVRDALKSGNFRKASQLAHGVYRLTPVGSVEG